MNKYLVKIESGEKYTEMTRHHHDICDGITEVIQMYMKEEEQTNGFLRFTVFRTEKQHAP